MNSWFESMIALQMGVPWWKVFAPELVVLAVGIIAFVWICKRV